MHITMDFGEFLLLIITIVAVFLGIYTVRLLKKIGDTVDTVNRIITHSEFELEGALSNIETLTREAGILSGTINSISARIASIGDMTTKFISEFADRL